MTETEQLKNAEQLVEQAATLARSGDFGAAKRRLDEAGRAVAGMAADDNADRLAVLASVHEGKGQVALGTGELDEAHLQLTTAVDLLDREGRARGATRYLHKAIALLNLSAACGQLKRHEEALDANGAALEALTGMDDARQSGFLRMAALHSRGMLLKTLRRPADASAVYEEAIVVGEGLPLGEHPEAAELLTELRLSAAITRGEQGAVDVARSIAQTAAAEAWNRVEAGQQRAVPQYLNAQMNLISFNEAVGDFAGAEDALFRVLKLVGPEPRVLGHGRAMYQRLLAFDDAALDAGNLPRDEVLDSLAELDRIASTAAPA